MKAKLLDHLLGAAFVAAVLLAALLIANGMKRTAERTEADKTRQLGDLSFADLHDPFQRALLEDAANVFYPGQYDKNKATVKEVIETLDRRFSDKLQGGNTGRRLTMRTLLELLPMYATFTLIYLVVMFLTYYGVQTIAVWRFCRERRAPAPSTFGGYLLLAFKKTGMVTGSFILFCPAYVIAYSIRTSINTDTVVFMLLLAVLSNGLLMVYANKFYAFLVAESRKGYVENAVVKNLRNGYAPGAADGIAVRAILRPFKRFDGHVFGRIFDNARFQYYSSIKEQASFLISGLIIIEMALNIHGYLNYEMLRQMLYKNYDIVIAIVLMIFFTVKLTEAGVDLFIHAESKKYENRD